MLPKHTLSLAERLSVLNRLDSGSSERAVSEVYGVGKGTINRIKNNKDSILKATDTMDEDVLKKRKHTGSTAQQDHIEKAVVEFLRLARNAETKDGFTVTGPMLKFMALEEAKRIGIDNFHASDGWLTRVKERHGIKGKVLSGEASAVDPVVIDNWQTRLAEIILDYCEEDIFNCDETGLFWLQSSSRSLVLPGDSAHGGKVDKKRLTLLLCSSWMGEKIKPLLIWKSENPRALKGVDKKKLLVTYRSQKKA